MNSPIILFGTGRSGTTIFMEALFRHPDLAYFTNYLEKFPSLTYLNFLRYIFDNKIYRVFGSKPQLYKTSFINPVINKPAEAYKIWDYLLQNKINFKRDFLLQENYNNNLHDIREYINKCIYYQGKERIAVKITGPSRITFFNSIDSNTQFIWLKRNFIPTLSSFLKVNFWQNRKTGNLWWDGAYSDKEIKKSDLIINDPVLLTAFQLKKIIEVANNEVEYNNARVKIINYEQFVQNPKLILAETLSWLELSSKSVCFDYLNNNKIINKNRRNSEYFDSHTLKKIENLVGREFLENNTI